MDTYALSTITPDQIQLFISRNYIDETTRENGEADRP